MGLFSGLTSLVKKVLPVATTFLGGPIGGALGGIAGAALDSFGASRDREANQSFNSDNREENRYLQERAAVLGREDYATMRADALADQDASYRRMLEAGTAEGFNPLTLLGAGGQGSFAGTGATIQQPGYGTGSTVAPLASASVAGNFVRDVSDTLTNLVAQRKEAEKKEAEIETREKEKRSAGGVEEVLLSTRDAASRAPGPGDVRPVARSYKPWFSDGREHEDMPTSSGPGLTEISNSITDKYGGPVTVPGADGEPWGIDEVATAVVVGGPQLLRRGFDKWMEEPVRLIGPRLKKIDEAAKRFDKRGMERFRKSPAYRGGNLWLDYDWSETKKNYPKLMKQRKTPKGQRVTW